ncbi:MAG TPA: helix-turn-helix domain-containing protein [Firmicutes bacterium]|nr:helix-turn-helix domain-containing protein [Candidatus Fermentithermobacillaceae bacterium]
MAGEVTAKLKEMGARIRARRESLGLSIADVQDKTKIRSKYLLAIEEGDDSISPGKAYFRVFLKTYANFLGLDGLEFSRAYEELTEAESQPGVSRESPSSAAPAPGVRATRPAEKKPVPEQPRGQDEAPRIEPPRRNARQRPRRRGRSTRGSYRKFFLAALLIAAIGWGFYALILRPPKTAPSAVPGGGRYNQPSGDSQAPGASKEPGSGGQKPPETTTVTVTRKDPDNSTTVFQVAKGPLELTFATTEGKDSNCWVRVTADGKVILERTLAPGETQKIRAEREIRIRAGKPWVLKLELNGQDLGMAGPYGPVKDLVFTVESATTQ